MGVESNSPLTLEEETTMKTIPAASLLALASNLAVAGPLYSGLSHTSLYAFEKGNPDEIVNAGYSGSGKPLGNQNPRLTSLNQFEQGDPDV
jgi:hypothetical protein